MTAENKLTGKHVLAMLIVFFGVMIVANAVFVTVAVRSFPGESQKKSYMQGLNYNEALAERAAQAAFGWRAEVSRIEHSGALTELEIRVYDSNDALLSGLVLTGDVKRPVHDEDDRALAFEELEQGRYRAQTDRLALGVWNMSARAENAKGERLDIATRVRIE